MSPASAGIMKHSPRTVGSVPSVCLKMNECIVVFKICNTETQCRVYDHARVRMAGSTFFFPYVLRRPAFACGRGSISVSIKYRVAL